MKCRATIHDVARECGVSTTTVSFALNPGGRPVSVETRRRVTETAERLGYRASAVGRALQGRATNQIAILFENRARDLGMNTYLARLMLGVIEAADERDRRVLVSVRTGPDDARLDRLLAEGRCDGYLLVAPREDDPALNRARSAGPCLAIAGPRAAGLANVLVDNAAGVAWAVAHLRERGHRRILHLTGDPRQRDGAERCTAFLREVPDGEIVGGTFEHAGTSYNRAMAALARRLGEPDRPTAILAGGDRLAFGAISVAREAGLSVPGDLSVIGWDDEPAGATASIPLTTLSQPLLDMAHAATDRLISAVAEGRPPTGEVRFAPTPVVRASVGLAPTLPRSK